MTEEDRYAQLVADSWEAYHDDRSEDAVTLARQAIELQADDGRAHYILACALERSGRLIHADRSFRRAAQCDNEPHLPPFRVSWRYFEAAVAQACDALPDRLQASLAEIDLVLSDYPGAEVANQEVTHEMLGLFHGPVQADRAAGPSDEPMLPPRIHLYRRAHEHIAASALEFIAESQRSLNHELGHYLGFDEDDMVHFGLD